MVSFMTREDLNKSWTEQLNSSLHFLYRDKSILLCFFNNYIERKKYETQIFFIKYVKKLKIRTRKKITIELNCFKPQKLKSSSK